MSKVECRLSFFPDGCEIKGEVDGDQGIRIRNDFKESGIRKAESCEFGILTGCLARNDDLFVFFDKYSQHFKKTGSFRFSMLGKQVGRLGKCIRRYKYLINLIYQRDQSFVGIFVKCP